jgi:hypothetical protein
MRKGDVADREEKVFGKADIAPYLLLQQTGSVKGFFFLSGCRSSSGGDPLRKWRNKERRLVAGPEQQRREGEHGPGMRQAGVRPRGGVVQWGW